MKQKADKKADKKKLIGKIVLLLLVLILGIGAVIYGNSDAGKVSRGIRRGQKYLDARQYDKAITAFQAVLETDEMNVKAYEGLADAYIGKEDFDSAVSVLKNGFDVTGSKELYEKRSEAMLKAAYQKSSVTFSFELTDIHLEGFDLLNNHFEEICEKLDCQIQSKSKGLSKGTVGKYGTMMAWVDDTAATHMNNLMISNGWSFLYQVPEGGKPYLVLQYPEIEMSEKVETQCETPEFLSFPIALGDSYEACAELLCKDSFLASIDQVVLKEKDADTEQVILYSLYCKWGTVTYYEDRDEANNKLINFHIYMDDGEFRFIIKFDAEDKVSFISIG